MRTVGNIPILRVLGPIQLGIAGKVSEKWEYDFQVRSTAFDRQSLSAGLDPYTTSLTPSYQSTYMAYMSSFLHMTPRSHIISYPGIHSCLISMGALVP
jgi:hypothetical protein